MANQPDGAIVSLTTQAASDIIFAPDGSRLYVARAGAVVAYDATNGQLLKTWSIGTELGGIDISPDGKYLAVAEKHQGPSTGAGPSYSAEIYGYRLDLETGASTRYTAQTAGANWFVDTAFLADGRILFSSFNAYISEPLKILDPATGVFTAVAAQTNLGGPVSATSDKSHFLFGSGPVLVYTPAAGTVEESAPLPGLSFPRAGVQAISPSGKYIAQGLGLTVYNSDLEPVASLAGVFPNAFTFNITGLAFSPDDAKLYVLERDARSVYVFRTSDWSLIGGYPVGSELMEYNSLDSTVIASADGEHLAVIGSETVQLIDLSIAIDDGPTAGPDQLEGTDQSDYILGFAGNDFIDGMGGADRMLGGPGDDTYYIDNVNDLIFENAGEGHDTAVITYTDYPSYTPQFQVEEVVLGKGVAQASGNEGDNLMTGNGLGNRMFGGAGNDTLVGNAGNDRLDGEAGKDRMIGGLGNDWFYADNVGDVVVEDPDAGLDRIYSYISYTLAANVEELILVPGSKDIDGVGNALDNVIVGNSGKNSLSGGAGDDTLTGGVGDDTIDGGDGVDIAIFSGRRVNYEVSSGASGYRLVDQRSGENDGTDVLSNIEIFLFADGQYSAGQTRIVNDAGAAISGSPLLLKVLDNDARAFIGSGLSLVGVSDPAHGMAVISGNDVIYTSDGGFTGTDSFTVQINDGAGTVHTSTATISVAGIAGIASEFREFTPDNYVGAVSGVGMVLGTNGAQDITVLPGPAQVLFDSSFNRGGDIVRLPGLAEDYSITRSGSSAVLTNGETTALVPIGSTGIPIVFDDGPRTLIFDQAFNELTLGDRTFSITSVMITATPFGDWVVPVVPGTASARLFLAPGGDVVLSGNTAVFGTAGNEQVAVIQGEVALDPSFNRGGDEITLAALISDFSAVLAGSSVKLDGTDIDVTIPVGTAGTTIHFADADRVLLFDAADMSVLLGSQQITSTAVTLG